ADRGQDAALVLGRYVPDGDEELGDADRERGLGRLSLREASERQRREPAGVAPGERRRRDDDPAVPDRDLDGRSVSVDRIRVAALAPRHTVTVAALRRRSTTPGSVARNASTCASVVARPSVTRSDPFASSRSRPSARST